MNHKVVQMHGILLYLCSMNIDKLISRASLVSNSYWAFISCLILTGSLR